MTKRELLQYKYIIAELKELELEREYWYAKAEKSTRTPSAVICAGGDPLPHIMDKLSELQNVSKDRYVRLSELRTRIEREIEKLDGAYCALMRAHYISGKNWETVADEMGYSVQHIWRLHSEALKKLNISSQHTYPA